jgi:hypothetical protein
VISTSTLTEMLLFIEQLSEFLAHVLNDLKEVTSVNNKVLNTNMASTTQHKTAFIYSKLEIRSGIS